MAIIFSHLSHGYVGGALESFKSFFPIIVGYFLIFTAIENREKMNIFIILLVLLTAFLAFEGVLQHSTGSSHGGMNALVEQKLTADGGMAVVPRIRWYGVFNDPNDLGLALVVVVPFLLNMALNRKYLLPVLCFPLIAVATYYTNSRGSMLAAFASIVAYFVIRYRSVKGTAVGLFLAAVAIVFGPSRLAQISATEESAYGRIEAWYQGYQMFKSSPFFGVGQGMFTDFHSITAHNSFVLVMAELGIVGTFFFTGMFYYSFNRIWQDVFCSNECNLSEEDIGILSSVFGSLFGLLTAMFFLSRAYMLVPFMFLALSTVTARLCCYNGTSGQVLSPPRRAYHLRNIALLSVLQIVFINLVLKIVI